MHVIFSTDLFSTAVVVYGLIIPEAFESVGCHGSVAHGMLNVLMTIFSEPGMPRGRGKIERYFRTLNQMLLCGLPRTLRRVYPLIM